MLEVVDDGAVATVLTRRRHARHVVRVAVAARVAGVTDAPAQSGGRGQPTGGTGHTGGHRWRQVIQGHPTGNITHTSQEEIDTMHSNDSVVFE